jgi:5-methylcytosine-specific restriction endonuclease McrA
MTKLTPEEIEIRVNEIVRQCKYEVYIDSKEWNIKRRNKLAEKDYTCERCGYCSYTSLVEIPLDVHHKTYKNFGNESPEDLEVLCRHCHNKEHSRIF